ncbi:MAG: NAD-dependent epimerase/dehydratase family protein [Candidatus Rokuibacteriota bacterium]
MKGTTMDADNRYIHAYQGQTVLVTGGSGAIGSNLCRALTTLGATVVVLDDLSSADPGALAGLPNCLLHEGSVLDHEALNAVFFRRPRIVFHLAALFANQKSVEHPEKDLMVNALGTLRVLQLAQVAGVDRVVYASSSSLLRQVNGQPIDEEGVSFDLHTPYQVTKLVGELYCNYFKNHYGSKIARVRFFNSYGPGEIPGRYRNVIPNFIYTALQRQPLRITGTGKETRDWTYVGDIVDGLLRVGVMDAAVGGVFNLATGRETPVLDIATWINEITGNTAGLIHTERRDWDSHSRRWANIDRARRLLGYEPQTDVYKGLEKTVAWFSENWAQIQARVQF